MITLTFLLPDTENFYDGERLALSYILNTEGSRIDYDFGPDHEFFDLLSESNGLLWYQDLSETQYLEIMAKLKLTGKVGFIIRTVNVGDHVTLSDGTDIGPFVGGELDGYTVLVPQNGLPDSAKGQDKLDVVFHVKTYEAYTRRLHSSLLPGSDQSWLRSALSRPTTAFRSTSSGSCTI